MKNQSRLSLIAEICAKRGMGPKILGIINPTKEDKREEISLNVSQDDKATQAQADLRDSDIPALPSRLTFDKAQTSRESESDVLLTPRERAEIRADLLVYRIKRDLTAPRNPFALALLS